MNVALILSGGSGSRADTDIPKQYIIVCGRPVICYCMESLAAHDGIDALQIVAAQPWQEPIREWMASIGCAGKFQGFSAPGQTRQLSIFHGLEDIRAYAEDGDYVLIHDAARPMLSPEQITDCLDGASGHDGAMPVLPMKDTVYYSQDGKTVGRLLDRSTIYAGQAPEIFLLGKYHAANKALMPDDIFRINGSTEPAVMAGMDIAMIPGDEGNFKITTKTDLERFRRIIDGNRTAGKGAADGRVGFASCK